MIRLVTALRIHFSETRYVSKDFYFSDSNLRRDRFMKQTLENDDGYLDLKLLLTFNRIKASWLQAMCILRIGLMLSRR